MAPVRVAFWVNDDPAARRLVATAKEEMLGGDLAGLPEAASRWGATGVVFDDPSGRAPESAAVHAALPQAWMAALDCEVEDPSLDLRVNLFDPGPAQVGPAARRRVAGLAYGILRREILLARSKHHITGRGRTILVSFGGSDPRRNTIRLLGNLGESISKDDLWDIVVGPAFRHAAEVRRACARLSRPVTLRESPPHLAERFAACDLAIVSGTTTMMEAAYLGVPFAVLAQTPAEVAFAQTFGRAGAADVWGLPDRMTPESLRDRFHKLLSDPKARRTMGRRGQRLVDGRGTLRVASFIVQGATRRRTSAPFPDPPRGRAVPDGATQAGILPRGLLP